MITRLRVPNVRFVDLLDDKYSQAMLYNGMVIVLYGSMSQFHALKEFHKDFVWTSYLHSHFHHVVHVVKTGKKYVVQLWEWAAEDNIDIKNYLMKSKKKPMKNS